MRSYEHVNLRRSCISCPKAIVRSSQKWHSTSLHFQTLGQAAAYAFSLSTDFLACIRCRWMSVHQNFWELAIRSPETDGLVTALWLLCILKSTSAVKLLRNSQRAVLPRRHLSQFTLEQSTLTKKRLVDQLYLYAATLVRHQVCIIADCFCDSSRYT